MMTISQSPRSSQRPEPVGLPRIAIAYLLTLISVAVGGLAFIGGLLAAQSCDMEGFGCLGWLIFGAGAWGLVTLVLLVVLALKRRLGLLFVVVTVALVVVVLGTAGLEPVRLLLALLAPGIAAWVSAPRVNDRASGRRHWTPRVAVLALAVLLIPIGMVAHQLQTASYRESLYLREGVAPVGLTDDQDWDYAMVVESVTQRGYTYEMEDEAGRELRVEIVHADDSTLAPPANCSMDPERTVSCEQLADGLFRSTDEMRPHRILVRDQSITRVLLQSEGSFDDAEFDRLVLAMETQSPRWLAERECAVCRLLPG